MTELLPGNLHVWDRSLRILVGIAMFAAGWLADDGSLALGLRVFAFYPLVTGVAGWCPVYALLRFSTRR